VFKPTCLSVERSIDFLNNPSFPLIRYSIGDVTQAPLETPSAGFAILKSVDGRENDLLIWIR